MKILALTICEDSIYGAAAKTMASWTYFHPDIKIIRFGTRELINWKSQYRNEPRLENVLNDKFLRFIFPFIMSVIWKTFKPDMLIKIGADCLVLDRVDEILEGNFDIAAARNDSDFMDGKDERHNRPDVIRDIPNHEWLNTDLVAITNDKFVDDYYKLTWEYSMGINKALQHFGKEYFGDDQMSMNVLCKLGGYNVKILDPKGSNLVYGCSGNWSGENPPFQHNWPAWKSIYYDEKRNKCYLPDNGIGIGERLCKVLHWGGGYRPDKLKFDIFNDEFRKYLKKVTGFDE